MKKFMVRILNTNEESLCGNSFPSFRFHTLTCVSSFGLVVLLSYSTFMLEFNALTSTLSMIVELSPRETFIENKTQLAASRPEKGIMNEVENNHLAETEILEHVQDEIRQDEANTTLPGSEEIMKNITSVPIISKPEAAQDMRSNRTDTVMQETREPKEGIKVKSEETIREQEYTAFLEATVPDPALKTLGFKDLHFYSGFRNEAMVFTAFVLYAKRENCSQILLPSIKWKDLFGSDSYVNHEILFDVVHWNSFYPQLPKLVRSCPEFRDYDANKDEWIGQNHTMPYTYGVQHILMNQYKQYTRKAARNRQRDEAELLMLRGAFRPQANLRQHIQMLQGDMGLKSTERILCIHARVEPDMQKHPVCRDQKVRALKDIIEAVYKQFPDPSFSKVFIPISRDLLEKEGIDPIKSNNSLAGENLDFLNRLGREGMWNGTVKVFEGGAPTLVNTSYEKYSSITGSIVNYWLSLEATYFVGTRVSSWSTDVIATRFYRGNHNNFWYTPDGLEVATNKDDGVPPRFSC